MKLLLIDGNSIMNRGYFALPKELTNRAGLHTNAILGFMNIFFRIYEEEQPDHVAVAFDLHAPTFRHLMYPEYKGTRKHTEPELLEQFPVIKKLISAMGIRILEQEGLEADDLLGSMAKRAEKEGYTVTILSGDRDLLQLATEKICIRIPKTSKGKTTVYDYHAKEVEEEYGVNPAGYLEMKGLMGDSSDNIPGVAGVGPKTAEKLIREFHTVDNLLAHLDEVTPEKLRIKLTEQAESARFSRVLSEIRTEEELLFGPADTRIPEEGVVTRAFLEGLKENQLYKLLGRFSGGEESKEELGKVPPLTVNPYSPDDFEGTVKEAFSVNESSGRPYFGLVPRISAGIITGAYYAVGERIFFREGGSSSLAVWIEEACKKGWTPVIEDLKSLLGCIALPETEETEEIFDCRIAAYLLDPLANDYPLGELLLSYAHLQMEEKKPADGEQLSLFDEVPGDDASAYALFCLYPELVRKLEETGSMRIYREIEHPLTWCLTDMEREGIRTSAAVLEEAGKDYESRLKNLEEEIFSYTSGEFNILSSKQLGVILFDELGLPAGKKTKSGYSTNADILNKLRDAHPIVPLILEYRKISKLLSTYAAGLPRCISSDGRIHTTFQQTVTATGRISSVNPNLQNLPQRSSEGRELRKAFIPREGYIFIDADYSQIELRVMAALSGDPVMQDAFRKGEDIHTITASQVFHVAPEDVDPLMRRRAKAVNFGIIYGISAFGLGEDLSISREEAKDYIARYFERFSGVKRFLDEQVSRAKKDGVVRTLFGRIRPMPELSASNYMQRAFGERVAMNAPIQGTAADIIKLAMISVWRELKRRGLKSRLILQIHDELLIETAPGEEEEVQTLLTECMTGAAEIGVPLTVDVHRGDNLYEAK